MNFGNINHFILFGGSSLLTRVVDKLKGRNITVVTSHRHSCELIDDISLREYIERLNIKIIISEDANNDKAVESIITKESLGISIGASFIFKKNIIDLFSNKLINMHGTRLPKNRGGGGFSWRILSGDRLGCNIFHIIDEKIDTGDIIFFEEYVYPSTCRIPIEYQEYSFDKYKEAFDKLLKKVDNKEDFFVNSQQNCFSSYFPRLMTDIHGYIDWNWDGEQIERFICAFDNPYKGAMTFVRGQRVRLKSCYKTDTDGIFHPFQAGIVYRKNMDSLLVATKTGTLIIGQVLNDNGESVFNNIRAGDRLYTTSDVLDGTIKKRVIYDSLGPQVKEEC